MGLVAVEQMELPTVTEEQVVQKQILAAPGQDVMPMTEGEHEAANVEGEHEAAAREVTDTKVESLKPCCAECCSITAVYCEWPECIGCSEEGQCCCCGMKGVCCKCIDSKDDSVRCCMIQKQDCWIQWPKTCCYGQSQVCCLDTRCAFPCTDNVPCIFNICCLTLCADWKMNIGCMKSVGDLVPRLKPEQTAS